MELLSRIKEKVTSFFSINKGRGKSFIDVANSTDNSPLYNDIISTVLYPMQSMIDGIPYLRYGQNDNVDQILKALLFRSATNIGVLKKVESFISGDDLKIELKRKLTGAAKINWEYFIENTGGKNISLHSVFSDAAFSYKAFGVAYLVVEFNASHTDLVSLKCADIDSMRMGMPNYDNEITYVVERKGGFTNKYNPTASQRKAEKLNVFTGLRKHGKRQVIIIRDNRNISKHYGIPQWISAYHFINSDYNFGKHIENSAETGFSPTLAVNMIGRNMSEEDQQEAVRKIRDNYMGSGGEKVIVSFSRKKEENPEYETIEANNLDKTIDVMSSLNDAKILTANSATSPALFGVMMAGQLGGTGNEVLIAYEIYKHTVAKRARKEILLAVKSAFTTTTKDFSKFEIVDPELKLDNKDRTTASDYTADKNSKEKKERGDYE